MANQITFQEDPGLAPEHVIDPGLAHDEDDQTLMTAVQELGPARESETDTGPAPDTATEMAEALS